MNESSPATASVAATNKPAFGCAGTGLRSSLAAITLSVAAVAAPFAAAAQSPEPWTFQGVIYGYFPTLSGTTTFPPDGSSKSASVDIDTILDNLKFVFMGSLEARKGEWGAFTDLIYMDVGATKSGSRSLALGGVVPANAEASVSFDMKGWAWTTAGTYRAVTDAQFTTDILFGVRQLDVTPKLGWQFSGNVGQIPLQDRVGNREGSINNWDAVVGVKGRVSFGDSKAWFVPYYLDMGTGASRFTWQAYTGVGYSFGSWDVLAAWRYLGYDFKSGEIMETLNFNGPAVAVVFRW